MRTRVAALVVMGMAGWSAMAAGQGRWDLRLGGGVALPVSELAGTDLRTGFGFEATAGVRVLPRLAVYAGWGWHRFAVPGTASALGAATDVERTGYVLGLRFERPLAADGGPALLLRAGGTWSHLELEDGAGNLTADSGHGLGWDAGVGVVVPLGARWRLAPAAVYRSLTRDLTVGGVTRDAALRFLSLELGLVLRL